MLIHTVYFWLKDDLDDVGRAAFKEGLDSLKEIETIDSVYIGVPAATEPRPVIDSSYDYALTVVFETLADHDAYQVHANHQAFVENHAPKWTKVLVYDAEG